MVTWVMNPLQVLYVDSKTPSSVDQKYQQAAFAYGSGTLHGHMLVIHNFIFSFRNLVLSALGEDVKSPSFECILSANDMYLMVNSITSLPGFEWKCLRGVTVKCIE